MSWKDRFDEKKGAPKPPVAFGSKKVQGGIKSVERVVPIKATEIKKK